MPLLVLSRRNLSQYIYQNAKYQNEEISIDGFCWESGNLVQGFLGVEMFTLTDDTIAIKISRMLGSMDSQEKSN